MKVLKPWMLMLMMVILGVVGWYFCYFYPENRSALAIIVLSIYSVAVFFVLLFFIGIKEDKLVFLQKCYVSKKGGNPYKNIYTCLSFMLVFKLKYEDILEVKYSSDNMFVSINMKNSDRYIISLMTYSKDYQHVLKNKFKSLNLINEGE